MPYQKIKQTTEKPNLKRELWEIFKNASAFHKLRILASVAGLGALGWGLLNLFDSEMPAQTDFTDDSAQEITTEVTSFVEDQPLDPNLGEVNAQEITTEVSSSLEDSSLDPNAEEINSEIEEEEDQDQNNSTPSAPEKKINPKGLAATTLGLGATGLGVIPNSNNKNNKI